MAIDTMQTPRNPSFYQINTRAWLTGLFRALDWIPIGLAFANDSKGLPCRRD
jgi:hypothetical protein